MPTLKVILQWCWKNDISFFREIVNEQRDCKIVMIKKGSHIPGKQIYSDSEVDSKIIELYTITYNKNNPSEKQP